MSNGAYSKSTTVCVVYQTYSRIFITDYFEIVEFYNGILAQSINFLEIKRNHGIPFVT